MSMTYSKKRKHSATSIPRSEWFQPKQEQGVRFTSVRGAVGGGSRIFSAYKALKSGINHSTCVLRAYSRVNNVTSKHLVSEFDPTKGGYVSICKKTTEPNPPLDGSFRQLPMHVYDLNFYPGNVGDSAASFPMVSTTQCDNINSRMWIWSPENKFITGKDQVGGRIPGTVASDILNPCTSVRWQLDNPNNNNQDTNQNTHLYRKNIEVDFMLYGTTKYETMFDVRIIKIKDPRFCPDFQSSLTDTATETNLQDFRQAWQHMMVPFTVNPLLKGEPGPRRPRSWFKTVARKVVKVGEQTGSIETLPCVRTSLKVHINKVYNYAWNNKGFTFDNDRNAYDGVLPGAVDNTKTDQDDNNNFVHKPYYTGRYYLVVRAMCPTDTSTVNNEDNDAGNIGVSGNLAAFNAELFDDKGHTPTVCQFIPTYDMLVRTKWALVRNG